MEDVCSNVTTDVFHWVYSASAAVSQKRSDESFKVGKPFVAPFFPTLLTTPGSLTLTAVFSGIYILSKVAVRAAYKTLICYLYTMPDSSLGWVYYEQQRHRTETSCSHTSNIIIALNFLTCLRKHGKFRFPR